MTELTPEAREQVRLSLLRYALRPSRPGILRASLRAEGYKLDDETVDHEITYLSDKGLIKSEFKFISPENKFWRTTADGRDYLASQGEEK